MSQLHDALEHLRDADKVFLDSEDQTKRWARLRRDMAHVAHRNGVSVEQIAIAVHQTEDTVRAWLTPPAEPSDESASATPDRD